MTQHRCWIQHFVLHSDALAHCTTRSQHVISYIDSPKLSKREDPKGNAGRTLRSHIWSTQSTNLDLKATTTRLHISSSLDQTKKKGVLNYSRMRQILIDLSPKLNKTEVYQCTKSDLTLHTDNPCRNRSPKHKCNKWYFSFQHARTQSIRCANVLPVLIHR